MPLPPSGKPFVRLPPFRRARASDEENKHVPVHDSADRPDPAAHRRLADLAAQYVLGLLPERHPRGGAGGGADPAAAGTHMRQGRYDWPFLDRRGLTLHTPQPVPPEQPPLVDPPPAPVGDPPP